VSAFLCFVFPHVHGDFAMDLCPSCWVLNMSYSSYPFELLLNQSRPNPFRAEEVEKNPVVKKNIKCRAKVDSHIHDFLKLHKSMSFIESLLTGY
jgi:hypothetical protein